MKLQFKNQKFQADAAKAVVDVFAGQPYLTPSYMMDRGSGYYQQSITDDEDFTGWSNAKLVPELNDKLILEHIQKIQFKNLIKPSDKLEGKYNLTIEMETGVGKTYTYIKTMYELNKQYGWSKFIVVVPSIAIREGVYKSFQVTQDHFAGEYGKKIRFFIYSSAQLTEIDRFASDSSINVMIINSQAFNAKGKDARRIYMKLDEFRSRRPIDIIAKTNPILIIDEPQSVEGAQTKERLKEFKPLMTLRYSATPREYYNLVYRLDALDAYNKKLVKKIVVKGITESGSTATESFVYLESVNLSKTAPTATIEFDYKDSSGIRKVSRIVNEGYNLYDNSNQLDEYKNNFVVKTIDGRDNSIEFLNGIRLQAGDVIGKVGEEQLRRIQIRETILSHIDRERQLFKKGIKVLSLFFIDEVANYRNYDESGQAQNGIYATMFEEEYSDIVKHLQLGLGEDEYMKYLKAIPVDKTHAGYFSIDKKGRMINSKVAARKEATSDDIDAYDLIMKNKELLLDSDPQKSPVRFIFSHSALREGWDNPNVFQICTLKSSSSEVRKRQEVGRGMRLCVNQSGERMDENVLGNNVQNVNVLTVIASESYESFAKELQSEMAESVENRPKAVTEEIFVNRIVTDAQGKEIAIDSDLASVIMDAMRSNNYIDHKGALTEKYFEDKANNTLQVPKELAGCEASLAEIVDFIYDENALKPDDARSNNVELHLQDKKLNSTEFKALWSKINAKSVYVVNFNTDELVRKCIAALDTNLNVAKIYFKIVTGTMEQVKSKEQLQSGRAFQKTLIDNNENDHQITANRGVKYDLIGKIVEMTGLTRKAVVQILEGISKATFDQFKYNPEDFIIKASQIINDSKAAVIIEHITYNATNDHYGTDIFTAPTIKGKLGINAMKAQKHLYDHIVYDSTNERDFASDLDKDKNVAVYVKLPNGFYISTPLGHYNPDWAIAFYEGAVKHIYFVAETKGSMNSTQLRLIEDSKIHCAREHFKAISNKDVVYDVVDSYTSLMEKVMK